MSRDFSSHMPSTPTTIRHLKDEVYADPKNIISVVFGIRGAVKAFVGERTRKANDLIKQYLALHQVTAYGWCVLADRVHLIAAPTPQKSLRQMVTDLQQILTKQALPPKVEFYGDFFDHVLRKTEDPKQRTNELFEHALTARGATPDLLPSFAGSNTIDLTSLTLTSADLALTTVNQNSDPL